MQMQRHTWAVIDEIHHGTPLHPNTNTHTQSKTHRISSRKNTRPEQIENWYNPTAFDYLNKVTTDSNILERLYNTEACDIVTPIVIIDIIVYIP